MIETFFQSLITTSYPVFIQGYNTIDGDSNLIDNQPIVSALWSPLVEYRDGVTYMVTHQLNNSPTLSSPVVVRYENNTVSHTLLNTPALGNDYHNIPVIKTDNSGRVYVFQESDHNDPLRIFKADDLNSIYSFTELEELVDGDFVRPAYPNIFKTENNAFYVLTRNYVANNKWDIIRYKASNGLEGWDNGLKITDCEIESGYTNTRHYIFSPAVDSSVNGWKYFKVMKRYTTVSGISWYSRWILKTTNFSTYWNHEETFSKNIDTEGFLTEAELNEYFLYYTAPSKNSSTEGDSFYMSRDGDPITFLGENGTRYIYYYDNGWTRKEIIQVIVRCAYHIEGDTWEFYINENLNEKKVINRYRTTDFFTSSIFIETAFEHPTYSCDVSVRVPQNFYEANRGDIIGVFACTDKSGTGIDAGDTTPDISNDLLIRGMLI